MCAGSLGRGKKGHSVGRPTGPSARTNRRVIAGSEPAVEGHKPSQSDRYPRDGTHIGTQEIWLLPLEHA